MKNTLIVNHKDRTIVMDRTFAKNATKTWFKEYEQLQRVRRDYPEYKVIQRQIRKNPHKETYQGLTYEYMEGYMMRHGTEEQRLANLRKYAELREIAECQGKRYRYPVIKSWFLDEYPEIVRFGIEEDASTAVPDMVQTESVANNTVELSKAS